LKPSRSKALSFSEFAAKKEGLRRNSGVPVRMNPDTVIATLYPFLFTKGGKRG
jgi:hypothetical protein